MAKIFSPVNLRVAKRLWPSVFLSLLACGITIGVGSVAMGALPGQQRSAPHLSPAAANAFRAKLMELSSRQGSSDKPIVITDNEVNSFVRYDPPPNLPPSVKDIEIHIKPEGIYGAANVNFDQLKPTQQFGDQLASRLLSAIFTGTQHVTALGVISSENGTGTLTIKDVHIGSTALSDWLVNWIVQTYIQSEFKINLSKPFLLPDHVTHIEFAPGKAIFVRGVKQKK